MCMTLIAGKNASATGRVLVGHNEDDYAYAVVRHGYVPHAVWEDNTFLPAEEGLVRVSQTKETFGYYWTRCAGPQGGLTAADSFINENGVCVVTNSSSGSKENEEASSPAEGICYELRRIIAERAKTARHGLMTAIEMLRTYGCASPGRIYTIADKDEAFMLQIVRGHMYIAARVPDDAVVIMPNHYTFHTLSDVPEMFYPENIISYAVSRGWYVPANEGDYSDFDFAEAYQNPERYRSAGSTLRQIYASKILLGDAYDAEKEGFPFCVEAPEKVSCEDLMRALSTHYEGTRHDIRRGSGLSPHFLTGVRRVCTGSTLESSVYEFEDRPCLTTVWTAFGRPCEVPYIPIHPLCGSVSAIGSMDDPACEAENHHKKEYSPVTRGNNGWQRFQDFGNGLEAVYSGSIRYVSAMKNELFREFRNADSGNLDYARTLSDAESVAFLHSMDEKNATYALQVISSFSDSLLSLVSVQPVTVKASDTEITVRFSCECLPDESSLVFRFGRAPLETGSTKAAHGSLRKLNNCYECSFVFSAPPLSGLSTGRYEFFISGLSSDGRQITGMSEAISE